MKKFYFLLIAFLVASVSFGQDLVLTGVIDGPLPGGTPKGLELYVVNNIPDLSIYGLESTTNGAAAVGPEFTFPADVVNAGTFIYVGTEQPLFNQYLGLDPTYINGVINVNGDDTIILYLSGVVNDLIGEIGVDGTGTAWDHLDGWAYRNDGEGPNTTFTASEWTFSGPNATDGCDLVDDTGTNAGCASVFPIGTYSPTVSMDPTINVGGAVSGLDYFEGNGPSVEGTFTVSGINLGADLTVTAPTNFEVSTTTGSGFGPSVAYTPDGGGTVSTQTVYVRLAAGLSTGPYSGDATASSAGATSQTVGLSGTVSPADPQITITGGAISGLNYTMGGGGPSPEDSFDVEGIFLTTDITVTAPSNFEVSLTSGSGFGPSVIVTQTGGTAPLTSIFVRLAAGLAVGPYSGDVTASSTGATDQLLAVSGIVFGPLTNAMVITGTYDGPLTGGTPKGVELFVLQNIPDLSFFGLGSANNGGGTDGQEFTFPAVAATAGSFIYVATEAPNFNAFFGFAPDYTDGSMAINGDDAVELFENGTVIDTFGDINMDGTGEPWDHVDGWAYRIDDTGPDGATFVLASWTFSGIDALDGETLNSTAAIPFPIGTYSNTLSVESFNNIDFSLYPNPNKTGILYISSSNNDDVNVEIYDILGKKVMDNTLISNSLNVSDLSSGLYIVKLSQGNSSITKKLVIE